MDIVTLAAWGEFLGGIAVVVTLIYLVGQVRTGNRLVRTESIRSWMQTSDQLGLAIAHDRELAEVWAKGLGDPYTLDSTDRIRFAWLMSCLVTSLQVQHNDHRLGLLPSADMPDWQEANRATLASPGGRWWWERRKGAYLPSFVEFVERKVLSR